MQQLVDSERERSRTHAANLVPWLLLTIVFAFPVLVWGQNDSDPQESPSGQAASRCETEGVCPPTDYPNSITMDDGESRFY